MTEEEEIKAAIAGSDHDDMSAQSAPVQPQTEESKQDFATMQPSILNQETAEQTAQQEPEQEQAPAPEYPQEAYQGYAQPTAYDQQYQPQGQYQDYNQYQPYSSGVSPETITE